MKIYRIPLAEYIACVANIAFAIGKYFTFGVAEYICLSLKKEPIRGVLLRTEKSCVEIFYTAFNFVSYRNKQDIWAPNITY